jgi:hypothetical protein
MFLGLFIGLEKVHRRKMIPNLYVSKVAESSNKLSVM